MQFIWPLDNHTISRNFYYLGSIYIGGQHMAIDIPASTGTPVKAVAAGKVLAAGYSSINGNYVEIAHTGGWRTKYRHLVEPAVVDVGAGVSQGQVIGKVGSTGWSTGPHLHLDLWNSSKQSPEAVYKSGLWAHDPELYLGQEDDMGLTTEDKEFILDQTRYLETRQNQHADVRKDEHAALVAKMDALQAKVDALEAGDGTGGLKRGDTVKLE